MTTVLQLHDQFDLPEDYLWRLYERTGAIGHAAQRYRA